jgi:hypothetical protein
VFHCLFRISSFKASNREHLYECSTGVKKLKTIFNSVSLLSKPWAAEGTAVLQFRGATKLFWFLQLKLVVLQANSAAPRAITKTLQEFRCRCW